MDFELGVISLQDVPIFEPHIGVDYIARLAVSVRDGDDRAGKNHGDGERQAYAVLRHKPHFHLDCKKSRPGTVGCGGRFY